MWTVSGLVSNANVCAVLVLRRQRCRWTVSGWYLTRMFCFQAPAIAKTSSFTPSLRAAEPVARAGRAAALRAPATIVMAEAKKSVRKLFKLVFDRKVRAVLPKQ